VKRANRWADGFRPGGAAPGLTEIAPPLEKVFSLHYGIGLIPKGLSAAERESLRSERGNASSALNDPGVKSDESDLPDLY